MLSGDETPVARAIRRGWRLDKLTGDAQIDAAVALAMCVDRAERQPAPVWLVAWL